MFEMAAEVAETRELSSVVDSLRSESLPDLPDALVEESFCELQRGGELLEVERLRRLAELERRRVFLRDGHLSAAAWLVSRYKVSWGSARDQVHLARSWSTCPDAEGSQRALGRGQAHTCGSSRDTRGVIVRDRACRFPGCERPHAWCDAHPPHRALGRWRGDIAGEPAAFVQASPQVGPRQGWVPLSTARWSPGVQAFGRIRARGARTTLRIWGRRRTPSVCPPPRGVSAGRLKVSAA